MFSIRTTWPWRSFQLLETARLLETRIKYLGVSYVARYWPRSDCEMKSTPICEFAYWKQSKHLRKYVVWLPRCFGDVAKPSSAPVKHVFFQVAVVNNSCDDWLHLASGWSTSDGVTLSPVQLWRRCSCCCCCQRGKKIPRWWDAQLMVARIAVAVRRKPITTALLLRNCTQYRPILTHCWILTAPLQTYTRIGPYSTYM